MLNVGLTRVGVIHRGFSRYGKSVYRNSPQWQIPLALKQEFPDIQILCDASHIAGNRENLYQVSQTALNLNFDGVMLETHPTPDDAWSDAAQQVTPAILKQTVLDKLIVRRETGDDPVVQHNIGDLRAQIDLIDKELFQLFADRMNLAEKIGEYKKSNNITIYQQDRWAEILERTMENAGPMGLSSKFVDQVLKAIHQESINRQESVMQGKSEDAVK